MVRKGEKDHRKPGDQKDNKQKVQGTQQFTAVAYCEVCGAYYTSTSAVSSSRAVTGARNQATACAKRH